EETLAHAEPRVSGLRGRALLSPAAERVHAPLDVMPAGVRGGAQCGRRRNRERRCALPPRRLDDAVEQLFGTTASVKSHLLINPFSPSSPSVTRSGRARKRGRPVRFLEQ